jgi:predicted esterase
MHHARTAFRLTPLLAMAVLAQACGIFDELALAPQLPDVQIPDVGFDVRADVGVPLFPFPDGFGGLGLVGPDGLPISGESIGATCDETTECRTNLVCQGGLCAGQGTAQIGAPCLASAECSDGLVCGPVARCQPEGTSILGDTCQSPFDCSDGLRCNLYGFTGVCEAEGTSDIGQACETSADCAGPLGCGADNSCRLPFVGGLNFMPQESCEATAEGADFGVYFEFQPTDETVSWDFYRMPFPNDALIRNGGIDLSGHPNPGENYLGGDILGLYLDALEDTFDGFSINPTVLMRFTTTPDYNTVTPQGENQSLFFMNIDPDSPNYGSSVLRSWQSASSRQPFICQNWIAIRGGWETPLEHNTTYAVYLTDSVRGPEGQLPVRSPAFAALLSSTTPADGSLTEAWQAYQPLRDWFAVQGVTPLNIIGATVFTTADPDSRMEAIRNATQRGAVPELQQLTVCDDGVQSPCADGTPARACVNQNGDFIEVHATYQAPVLQQGTRPYFLEQDGGDVIIQGDTAVVQATETVCAAMTIPLGDMPENGWPVVMYGHGTGGSFTSMIRDISGRLANVALPANEANPAGRTARFVGISIDGVQHGARRGTSLRSSLSPENLFYNFLNPRAARGNVEQGAADYFTLTRLLQNLEWTAAESPTGAAFKVDAENIFFFGHSQGAQVGAPFMAYEPEVDAAVFSGAGGSLALSLLSKTSPVDIATGVRLILAAGNQLNAPSVNSSDPIISLLQWYIDPVDSLSYTPLFIERIRPERGGVHIFQSFGFGDSYSPEDVLWAFAASAGLRQASPPGTAIREGYPQVEFPVRANRNRDAGQFTAVLVAAQPNGYDGHFVVFRDSALAAQAMEFLATAYFDEIPTVSAP